MSKKLYRLDNYIININHIVWIYDNPDCGEFKVLFKGNEVIYISKDKCSLADFINYLNEQL